MKYSVNLAIQLLPMHLAQEEAYRIIDLGISFIRESGLTHIVTPFETVVEGPYDQVMQLVADLQELCLQEGAESLLINMKLHRSAVKDLTIEDKIGKFR